MSSTERSEGHPNDFDVLPLAEAVTGWVADRAGIAVQDVDPGRPLIDFGLSSIDAVELAGRLADRLGRPVPATLAWEFPTIDAVLAHLSEPTVTTPVVAAPIVAAPIVAAPVVGGAEVPDDAVAIVGIGCRLPGASGPEALWRLFSEGGDAVGVVPPARWQAFDDGTERTAAAIAGTSSHGGFLPDVESFDAEFFGIPAEEAQLMDPQHRMLLEVTWEALQHSAIDPARLRGTHTGVYVGISTSEYSHLTAADLENVHGWTVTGSAMSIAANRLSYLLDLHGPSMAVDTACSSSLVALHLAVRALRTGECDAALVGGVNVLLSPTITLAFGRGGGLASGGRCRPFDAAAEGMVRAEGCGVVVLKRYADALNDGDRIVAIVRGSAVSSDGRSNGLVAPNPTAQRDVLVRAYADAHVSPSEVDYVEAHGTGTPLGDPVEARALGMAIGSGRPAGDPLLIGSAKSNVGHLEAASGITGVIKAALSLQHGVIPASLHYDRPNPQIPFDDWGLRVVDRPTAYPVRTRPSRAGVSAFGFGGTNAHVVLEAARPTGTPVPAGPDDGPATRPRLSVLTDLDPDRLRRHAAELAGWVDAHDGVTVDGVADTLARRGRRGAVRAVVTATDRRSLAAGLHALADGVTHPGVVTGSGKRAERPGVWMFGGYGTHWAGMGRELMRTEPAFAAEVDRLDPLFDRHLGWDLRSGLTADEPGTVARAQPLTFGVQLALAALWRDHGVQPAAVLGHSMGEVAAAVVAGALSVEDGVRVIAVRSKLLARTGPGAMAVVELAEHDFGVFATGLQSVHIAVVGGPRHLVVTGAPDGVAELARRVADNGGLARTLTAEGAGHSPAVDHLLPELVAGLAELRPLDPAVPFYSTAESGRQPTEPLDAVYWAANLRNTVRLSDAVWAAAGDGHQLFIEISPHPVLTHPVLTTLGGTPATAPLVVASTTRGADDAFHRNLAVLHANGLQPGAHRPDGDIVDLPAAPWRRSRHWHDVRPPAPAARVAGTPVTAPGTPVVTTPGTPVVATPGTTVVGAPAASLLDGLLGVAWTAGATPPAGPARPACLLGAVDDELIEAAQAHPAAAVGVRTAGYGRVPGDILRSSPHLVFVAAPTGADPDPHAAQRVAHGVADAVRSALDVPGRRLWLVTRGAAAVRPGEAAHPDGAWIRGTVRSLALEQPSLRATWLDLDADAGATANAETLWTELSADDPHDEIAWRDGRRHTAHLTAVPAPRPLLDAAVQPGAAYLVTGGFRGIGLEVARWLAAGRAGRVVLAGRTGAPPESAAALDAIRAAGVDLVEVRGDLTDPGAASRLVRAARSGGLRLAGIVHGAAVPVDRLAGQVGAADLRAVWTPKVHGAWLLHRAVTAAGATADLDWWVSLSSAAALLGSPGQSAYAGANAWLDGFASWQRSQGVPAWSVNFGPWARVGGAAGVVLGGIAPIDPVDGIAALDALLRGAPVGVGVLRLDVSAAATAFPEIGRLPFFAGLTHGTTGDGSTGDGSTGGDSAVVGRDGGTETARGVRDLPYPVAVRVVTDRVAGRVAAVLGLDAPPAPDVALPELGLDSLGAMRVKHLIETDFAVALPTALLVRGGTLTELAQHITAALGVRPGVPAPAVTPTATSTTTSTATPAATPAATSAAMPRTRATRGRRGATRTARIRLVPPAGGRTDTPAPTDPVGRPEPGIRDDHPGRDDDGVGRRPVGPRDGAERLVLRLVEDVFGRDDVGVTEPLREWDDASAQHRFAARLAQGAGGAVPLAGLPDTPTAEALAEAVRAADRAAVQSSGLVRPLRTAGSRPPLFLAHPAGGTTQVYHELARLLGDDQPCYGLERIDEGGPVPDRATRYLDAIRTVQPDGPYRLGGWSFGGALAYELACQLTAKGETVQVLALIDAGLPQPLPSGRAAQLLRERFVGFADYLRETYGAPVDVRPEDLAGLDEDEQFALLTRRMTAAGVPDLLPPAILTHQLTSHSDTRALDDYRPERYAGPVVLYRSTQPTPWNVTDERYEHTDDSRGWDRVCPDLRCVPVDAHHLNLLDPPAVGTVADDLRRIL